MPSSLRKREKPSEKTSLATARMEQWKLEDAKARFSEVVRRAGSSGPQLVTIRGKEAAVILAPEQYRRMLPKDKLQLPLVRFLQGLGLSGVDIERENDSGRDIVL
jgi:antitoxin Phd